MDWLKTQPIDEIMTLPEVEERVQRIREQDARFRESTLRPARGSTATSSSPTSASVSPLPVGNRFLVYTLFPQANISLRVHWGPSREHVAVAVGHSIFNRTSRTNVGELMSRYGGGGHRGAGTCLLPRGRGRREDRGDGRRHEEGRLRPPASA